MKWRTDKPTANVIVALVRFDDENMIGHQITEYHFRALERFADDFYIDYYADAEHIPIDRIVKWVDLEENEVVTDCHQLEEAARNSWFNYEFDCGALYSKCYKDGFKAGANWQNEQDHNACYQCEKAYDNVFFRGEQHAIKMLKEEAIGGTVCGRVIDHINIRFADGVGKYLEPKDISHIPADKSKYNIGDKVKVIILKDE